MKKFPYDRISVLIMPTDYCNMNCVYCFNKRKNCLEDKKMSLKTVQKIFEITIPYYKEVNYIWHGGEPLSMGLEFYKNVFSIQKAMNKTGTAINNSIQSNLTLLNHEMATFFMEHKVDIGGSFDGTQNELTRHNTEKILQGINCIKECGGSVNLICVVQSKNINYLIEDYKWFNQNKINYTLNQYISPLSPKEDELYVSAEYYIQKICELYDYWSVDQNCTIKISYFDFIVDYILFHKKKLCCYNSCLGKFVGILEDGNIFNCNREFSIEYCYGNVYDYADIRECFESSGFHRILRKAIARREECKADCELFGFCSGGCNSNALISEDINHNLYLCKCQKGVYHYIEQHLLYWMSQAESQIETTLNMSLGKKILQFQRKRTQTS